MVNKSHTLLNTRLIIAITMRCHHPVSWLHCYILEIIYNTELLQSYYNKRVKKAFKGGFVIINVFLTWKSSPIITDQGSWSLDKTVLSASQKYFKHEYMYTHSNARNLERAFFCLFYGDDKLKQQCLTQEKVQRKIITRTI